MYSNTVALFTSMSRTCTQNSNGAYDGPTCMYVIAIIQLGGGGGGGGGLSRRKIIKIPPSVIYTSDISCRDMQSWTHPLRLDSLHFPGGQIYWWPALSHSGSVFYSNDASLTHCWKTLACLGTFLTLLEVDMNKNNMVPYVLWSHLASSPGHSQLFSVQHWKAGSGLGTT